MAFIASSFSRFLQSVMYRKQFHFFPPVPETGCPMGHAGLTVDRTWQHPAERGGWFTKERSVVKVGSSCHL